MRLLAPLAVVAVLTIAAPAHGAVVELVVTGTTPAADPTKYTPAYPALDHLQLRVTADPGDADDLRVDGLRVSATSPLRAGPGCRSDAPGFVVCDPEAAPRRHEARLDTVRVDLADGDDRAEIVSASVAVTVLGGEGGDTLVGGGASLNPNRWVGGGGPDRLVDGRAWTLDYSERREPVDVSLDGIANDGAAGEGDDAGSEARVILGGAGADRLRGGARQTEWIAGRAGDDLLEAGGAPSDPVPVPARPQGQLDGGPGADRLLGGPGRNSLAGGAGDDVLFGGGGADELLGGAGADRFSGDEGDDTLLLDAEGDGARDVAEGGPGRDLAFWDTAGRGHLFVDLRDGAGPDGLASEQDALGPGVEDVTAAVRRFSVRGDGGPNVLWLHGTGVVRAGAGDDEIHVNEGHGRFRARVAAGPGADQVFPGDETVVDTRDGGADRIICAGDVRDLLLDAGRDTAILCVKGAWVGGGLVRSAGRRPAGSLARFRVHCADRHHDCRARLSPELVAVRARRGRHLPPVEVRIRAFRWGRAAVRIPAGTRPGRYRLLVRAMNRSPWRGVPPWRNGRGEVRLTVTAGGAR